MSTTAVQPGVVINNDLREILVEDWDTLAGNATLVSNPVPKGVNIFALLNLEQPLEVTNLTGWKVIVSDKNNLYPNLLNVFEVRKSRN